MPTALNPKVQRPTLCASTILTASVPRNARRREEISFSREQVRFLPRPEVVAFADFVEVEQVRRTPVSIATIDGSRYLVAAFSDAARVQNVRASGSGTLGRGRNVERVRLVELPVEERAPVLRAFLQQVRGAGRFFGSGDPDVVAAHADRYPVFRLTQSRPVGP